MYVVTQSDFIFLFETTAVQFSTRNSDYSQVMARID